MKRLLIYVALLIVSLVALGLVEHVTGWDLDFEAGWWSAMLAARALDLDWRKPSSSLPQERAA